MAFNTLVSICPTPKTSFSESGNTLSMEPDKSERVFFFNISGQKEANFIRQDWNMQDKKLCDGIIFYAVEIVDKDKKQDKVVICLVEMKGADISHAIEQVKNTRKEMEKVLKQSAKGRFWNTLVSNIIWKAYILQNSSAHTNKKEVKDKIEEANNFFNGANNFDVSRNKDIGKFLRR